MEPDDHPDESIPSANHVTWSVCSHGTLYLTLHDDDGEAMALCAFATPQGFVDQIQGSIDAWTKEQRGGVN